MAKRPLITTVLDAVVCTLQMRPDRSIFNEIERVSRRTFELYNGVINPNNPVKHFRFVYGSKPEDVQGCGNRISWAMVGGTFNLGTGVISIYPDHLALFCKYRFGMTPQQYLESMAVTVTLHELSHSEQCFYQDYKLKGSLATEVMETRNDQRTIKFIYDHWDELKREFPNLEKWYFDDRLWENVTDSGVQEYQAMPLKYKGLRHILWALVVNLRDPEVQAKTSDALAEASNLFYTFDGQQKFFVVDEKPVLTQSQIDSDITDICKRTGRDLTKTQCDLAISKDKKTVGFIFR